MTKGNDIYGNIYTGTFGVLFYKIPDMACDHTTMILSSLRSEARLDLLAHGEKNTSMMYEGSKLFEPIIVVLRREYTVII